jgi:O-antigen/teichoic acid export membrane protein
MINWTQICGSTAHFIKSKASNTSFNVLARGTFWVGIGNALARLLTLSSGIIIARTLGQEAYGEYSFAINSLNMLCELAMFGAGLASAKYISEVIEHNKQKASLCLSLSLAMTLGLGCLMALVLILFDKAIATHFANAKHLSEAAPAIAIGLIGAALNGTALSLLSGLKHFKLIGQLNITTCTILFSAQFIACQSGQVIYVLYSTALGYTLACSLSLFVTIRAFHKKGIGLTSPMTGDSLLLVKNKYFPAFISGLSVLITAWLANYLLTQQPSGFKEMALYAVANQWKTLILFIPLTMASVALPLISGKSQAGAHNLMRMSLLANALLTLLTIAVILPMTISILRLYGSEFAVGYRVFYWMFFTIFLISINSSLSTYLTSQNQFWFGAISNVIWGIVFISLAYYFIPLQGALGLMYAYAGSYTFHLMLQIIKICQKKAF